MRKLAMPYEEAYTKIRNIKLDYGAIFDEIGHRMPGPPELHLSNKKWPYLFKLEK